VRFDGSLAVAAALALLAVAVPPAVADFTPSIAVSEEYTDNVFETVSGKREDFITRVLPGVALKHNAPIWDWDMGYYLDYRNYLRNSRNDELIHSLALKGNVRVIENFLFLDVADTYKRVSLDVSRDVTTESLFINQTDQNIATVSPYLLWRPGEKTALKTGYRFIDTRYWGAGIEKREHGTFASLNHELSARFSVNVDYAYGKTETDTVNIDRHDLSGGFRLNYTEKSFLFGNGGNSWQRFSTGTDVSNPFWTAGITHDLGVAVTTLDTRVQFVEDPQANSTKETSYSGKLDKELKRGAIGLAGSYSEFVNTQTGERTQRKLAFGTTARYELLPSLIGNLAATSERFSVSSPSVLPYRITGIAGLSYAFNYGVTLGLNYTYIAYLTSLRNAELAKEINRVVVEVRKTF
jgi:hypothetical protein